MREPHEYVQAVLSKHEESSQSIMFVVDAERAVAAALADAEKYRNLLLRAIRNNRTCSLPSPPPQA